MKVIILQKVYAIASLIEANFSHGKLSVENKKWNRFISLFLSGEDVKNENTDNQKQGCSKALASTKL